MKNKILVIAALAFTVNAGAQNSKPTFCEDKSASMYHNIDGSRFSPIAPQWENRSKAGVHTMACASAKDYFCMEHNKMYAVVNGTTTCMGTYMMLQDGSMIMPNGTVIGSSGKVVHLKNGERINIQGVHTCTIKDNTQKEQAAGPEN